MQIWDTVNCIVRSVRANGTFYYFCKYFCILFVLVYCMASVHARLSELCRFLSNSIKAHIDYVKVGRWVTAGATKTQQLYFLLLILKILGFSTNMIKVFNKPLTDCSFKTVNYLFSGFCLLIWYSTDWENSHYWCHFQMIDKKRTGVWCKQIMTLSQGKLLLMQFFFK